MYMYCTCMCYLSYCIIYVYALSLSLSLSHSCSFSPDFTLSRVTSALRLHTSTTGILHFPLLATLPHNLLPICYNSSPHSELELLASYLSVPLWLVALTAMILATIFQVNWHARRLQQNIARMSVTSTPTPHGRDVPLQATGGSKFDLQSISEAAKSTVQNVISERVLVSEKRYVLLGTCIAYICCTTIPDLLYFSYELIAYSFLYQYNRILLFHGASVNMNYMYVTN